MVAPITTGNSLPLVALLSGPLRQAGLHVPLAFSPRELPSVGDDTPCYELPLPLNTNEVSFTFNPSFIIFSETKIPTVPTLCFWDIFVLYLFSIYFLGASPKHFRPFIVPYRLSPKSDPPSGNHLFYFFLPLLSFTVLQLARSCLATILA